MAERLIWDRDGSDWPNRSASRFIEAGGINWHVQVMGAGPVLLLLHGTGASTHSWAKAMPLLAEHFTVVCPDLPGHAFTDAPNTEVLTLNGMAKGCAALVEKLSLQPALAVGHSAGAAILIRAALDGLIAPKGIISFNGALLPFGGAVSQFFSPLAKVLVLNPFAPRLFAWRAQDKEAVRNVLKGTGSEVDDASLAIYTKLFQNTFHVANTLGMMASWDLPTLADDIPKLKSPLLLIGSSLDLAVKAEDAFRVRDKVPGSEVEVMKGVGHLSHEERPADIAARILAYWAQVAAAPKKAG